MKAAVSAAMSLLLAASLPACQSLPSPSQTAETVILARSARPEQELTVPRASARLHQGQLRFAIDYPPALQNAGFQTQALHYPAFARFQVAIVGIGLDQALYPAAADAEQNHTLAAACTASGCSVNATINNVPSGQNRVALIVAYDAAGEVIPGASLAAAFDIPPDSSEDQTVRLSYLSTPVGQVVQQLLNQNLNLLAADLDASALQQFIVQLTGATGDFPAFNYTQLHPSLINVSALVEDLKQNQGNVAALNPSNPDYVYTGGTVNGSVTGLLAGDSVSVKLTDPRTGAIAAQGNGNFSFVQVPPGEWQLLVEAPAGYSVSAVPAQITVTEGQTLQLDPISLTPGGTLSVTSLSTAASFPGETLLINGSQFAAQPEDLAITIAGQPIPTDHILVLNSSQLQVQLPADLPTGNTTVSVVSNGQAAPQTPALQVLTAPLSWSNNWGQLTATANEHVLAIAASTARPDQVWFGAKGDTGLGGIWHCESDAGNDSCSNILPAANVGAIQALEQARDSSPTQPGVFYAGSASAGVYVCESDCQTAGNWQQRNTGLGDLNVRALASDPQQPAHVYAATANGVYFSSDRGQNWSDINAGLEVDQRNLHALAIYRPNLVTQPVLYVGTEGSGVFRKQGAANWATINTGIFSQNGTGDEGTQFLGGVTVSALRPHPENTSTSEILYGGGFGVFPEGGILSSPWKVGIWQRTESGSTTNWEQVGNNGTNGFPCPNFTPSDINALNFLAIFNAGVSDLLDQCGSPGSATPGTGLESMWILDIVVDPANTSHIYTATRLDGAQTGGIYRSTDAGSSWSAFSNFNSATVLGINQLRLYAGTPTGLYRASE